MAMFLRRILKKASIRTHSKAMPPPVGGWNARDSLVMMKEDQAVILDNYFPDSTEVKLRKGRVAHKTGMTGNVDSLMVYSPTSGTQAMFAANDGSIYNVTSAGAIGAAEATGFSSNKWQDLNFGTSGGQFLFCVNGADTAQIYDGSTWGNSSFTGPDLTKLIWCNAHQKRIWTGEKNSLSAWYGDVNAISGALTEFPLYGVATLGGYLMGMATWTRDGGSGNDDVAMFITSEGEAILYSGTDPSSASTWSLVGVFRIGKPIGRRFYTKAGADVILITEDGFLSGTEILQKDRSQSAKAAISDQINKAVNAAIRAGRSNFGWQAQIYPTATMLIFNIPVSASTSHQYVFNTLTQAPCRFTGWNARCFAVMNNNLYYGGIDGTVYHADYGTSDTGSYIYGDILPAFSYFGYQSNVKKFGLCKPVWSSELEISPKLRLTTDFNIGEVVSSLTGIDYGDAALWGTAIFGTSKWAGGSNIFQKWKSVSGTGRAASLRILTATNNVSPALRSINYIWQNGGFLG